MIKSIRVKYTLGLALILMIAAIVLNLLIRQVFEFNLETTIKSSMRDLMRNSREYIIYNLNLENSELDIEKHRSELLEILNSFMLENNCEIEMRNLKGDNITNNAEDEFRKGFDNGTKAALQGKAVVNVKYSKDGAYSILSYPLYYKDKCLGIINISKIYTNEYFYNMKIVKIITLIETGIFLLIFAFMFLFISKLIKPILSLTKQVKKIGDGDYNVFLVSNSKDEVGILIEEFLKMNNKIERQIHTINMEKEKVLKMEKHRRDFFNNVTHELKTPLTSISGYAQILLDKSVDDEEFKERAVKRIYLESERMHKLVLDLINTSKGVVFSKEDKKKINIKNILSEICEDMNIKGNKYSIVIETNIKDGVIIGYENKIRQLLINVLDNAVKYSKIGQSIFVKAFNEDEFYRIEVENTGGPIPKDIYENIYNPFIRGKHTNEEGSSGLGLYICNEVIKDHNGEIFIQNGDVVKVIVKIPCLI